MKPYTKPDLEIKIFMLKDEICSSVENFSSYIDSSLDDWGEDPTIDSDESINW